MDKIDLFFDNLKGLLLVLGTLFLLGCISVGVLAIIYILCKPLFFIALILFIIAIVTALIFTANDFAIW